MVQHTAEEKEDLLMKEFRRWGFSLFGKSRRDFIDMYVTRLHEIVNGQDLEPVYEKDPIRLSADVNEAARYVFAEYYQVYQDEEDYDAEIDLLACKGIDVMMAPMVFSRRSGGYKLKDEFKDLGLKVYDVDPFRRFEFVPSKHRDVYVNRFIEPGEMAYDFRDKAMCAWYAQDQACAHCGAEAIHWNRSDSETKYRKWNKLICVECGSVYELKGNRSAIDMESNMTAFGNRGGGTFLDAYYSVRNSLPPGAKLFVAVFSRDPDARDKNGAPEHVVCVAEVHDVTPQLKPRSFQRNGRTHMHSKMHFAPGSVRRWFSYPPTFVDDKQAARDGLSIAESKVAD